MSDSAERYLNRELSWLEFNQRVLDEARAPTAPVLERLKFLAITASNLDEFFMVRVGGLQLLIEQGVTRPDPSGRSPAEQLAAIRDRVRVMIREQYRCLLEEVEPAMREAGIRRLGRGEMSERQLKQAQQMFRSEIVAILSPLAVESPDDFPLLANQAMNVCIRLEDPETPGASRYAILPLLDCVPRILTVHADHAAYAYLLLEEAVQIFADEFFPMETVQECVPFRITRNADLSLREDAAADLMAGMEQILDARRESDCVRLEIADHASQELSDFLEQALQVDPQDVFALPGPLDLTGFFSLTSLQGFHDQVDKPWPAQASVQIDPRESIFEVLSQRDVLLCHPYESFEPVVRLVEEASRDPDVLAIKQTLYRTSKNSPIIAALCEAAERGKAVTAVVELKARFDERRNIEWARSLEQASVQVFYGVKGLKTHAKVCIVVRREPHGLQRYIHFGTGNYNEATARLYSDISYMTSNEALGADATSFFNAITGYTQPRRFHKIEAAPIGLRARLLELIRGETQRKRQGQKARIAAKLNSLVDPDIIEALYEASQAGVTVQLNIRGICCLRPGVPGMSENINVVSIVDRFLEHARIMYFHHGGDELVFISSADWMPRNLDRRLELLVPVEEQHCQRRLVSILQRYFQDRVKARQLLPDGTYVPLQPAENKPIIRAQQVLYEEAVERLQRARRLQSTLFEPYPAPGSDSI